MSRAAIKPWVEVVSLHPDVLSESFSEDIFALDLGPLADGNPNVPAVYRDPEHFFRASYLTAATLLLALATLPSITHAQTAPRPRRRPSTSRSTPATFPAVCSTPASPSPAPRATS